MTSRTSAGMPELPELPELHEQAGEYVLGTLASAQRRVLDERLPHDADLREAIQAWEARLLPLTALVDAVAPSARLWQRIERSMQAQPMQETPLPTTATISSPKRTVSARRRRGWWPDWNDLAFWRGLSAASFVTAAVLAVLLVIRTDAPQPAPQFMVVLVAPQDKAPGWVIQAGLSRQLSLIPLGTLTVPHDKALQFWTKADGWKGPVSLGLVEPGRTLRVALDKLPPLQANQLFELTLEPVAGSPTGRPTGPIQFIGRAVKVL